MNWNEKSPNPLENLDPIYYDESGHLRTDLPPPGTNPYSIRSVFPNPAGHPAGRPLQETTTTPPSRMQAIAAAAGAAGGVAQSIYGGIFSVGNNLISQSGEDRRQQQSLELGNKQLSLLREQWERDWTASRAAGLYHPSQFASLGSDNVGRAYGRRLMSTVRAPRGSILR